jgi:hypothetical protein
MCKFHHGELRAQYYDFLTDQEETANLEFSPVTGHLQTSIKYRRRWENQGLTPHLVYLIRSLLHRN